MNITTKEKIKRDGQHETPHAAADGGPLVVTAITVDGQPAAASSAPVHCESHSTKNLQARTAKYATVPRHENNSGTRTESKNCEDVTVTVPSPQHNSFGKVVDVSYCISEAKDSEEYTETVPTPKPALKPIPKPILQPIVSSIEQNLGNRFGIVEDNSCCIAEAKSSEEHTDTVPTPKPILKPVPKPIPNLGNRVPKPKLKPKPKPKPNLRRLNIASWNVRTLMDNPTSSRPERRTALVARELARYDIDIAALSETRMAGEGSLVEAGAGYTFYWQGREEK
jgi:hypothetical protein